MPECIQAAPSNQNCPDLPVTSQPWVRDARQWRFGLDQKQAGLGHKPESSSATISAAGCGCLASATLRPAHNEAVSMSPVVSTIGVVVA